MPKPENVIPHQFKKGQSGNKKGRPKGVRSLSTILNEFLDAKIDYPDETGAINKVPAREAVILSLIKGATQGDIKFIREILDRTEGKAIQKTEITNSEESIPTIRIIGGLPD